VRILFLSGWFPYPPSNGSQLRIYHLLRTLARRHAVTLLTFADSRQAPDGVGPLRQLCEAVEVVAWKAYQPDAWRARAGWLSPTPRSVVDTYSWEMEHRIERTLSQSHYDLIIASQLRSAVYSSCFGGTPALFEEVELGVLYDAFAKAASIWRRCRFGLTWWKHRRYLARLLRHFRACTVVSECERRLLASALPRYAAAHVVPNGVDVQSYDDVRTVPQPDTLVFTGSLTYWANHDAMVWFLGKVYPLIRARWPQVRLIITGNHANLPLPAAESVTRTGLVEDIRPVVAAAAVAIVPMRAGGGTRLKMLEAMALGTPVVATSKGAEGLEVVDGEHALIADDPRAFADSVLRVLADAALRTRLTRRARQLVEQRYDWRTIGVQFETLVTRIAAGGEAR
jgi:polysaccharide biosynthesis protein PslH